jgi:hypothetical protein
MKKNYKKNEKIIAIFLFSIFFIVGVFTFRDYGISVDEEFQRASGLYWLNYVLNYTPFENFQNHVNELLTTPRGYTVPLVETNLPYGVIFDLPMALLEALFRIEESKNYYFLRHFFNFLLFFISSIFFYKLLSERFPDKYISLVGTMFYILSPRIYGNSFYNNKDLVFLSFVTIALYFCFKIFQKNKIKNIILFSFFASICTVSRILGIFLIFFYFIFSLPSISYKKNYTKNISPIFIALLSYVIFLIILWPYLWEDPVKNFVFGFNFFSKFYINIKMLFGGEYINSYNLPFSYVFTWIFITTPILYIILFIFGYLKVIKKLFDRIGNVRESDKIKLWLGLNEKKDLFVLTCLSSIICYLVVFKTPIYNGWRHIYFLNIFLVYLSTVGFYEIGNFIKSRLKINFLYHISILFLIFLTYKMSISHPYQSFYFNSVSNITHKDYEIDYWGISGKKFLDDILIKEKDNEKIVIGVASFLPLERSLALLDKNKKSRLRIVGQNYHEADYIFTSFITDIGKFKNDKYQIPKNFLLESEFILEGVKIYEVYKRSN